MKVLICKPDDYQQAYDDMLNRCNTADAPWYMIPANHKWFRNLAISETVVNQLESLGMQLPAPRVNIDEIRHKYHEMV